MSQNKKIRTLSIFRESYKLNRGTPIRVKNIMRVISTFREFELYTATKDDECDFSLGHLELDTRNFTNLIKLRKYIKQNQIDIVIFHTMSSALYKFPLRLLLPFGKYRTVLEMHGFIEEESKFSGEIGIFNYYFKKFYYSLIYNSFDLIVTCSHNAAEIISKYNTNTYPLYGGVFIDKDYSTTRNPPNDRTEISIGYSGNNREWQGLKFLINAFKILEKRSNKFKLNLMLSKKREYECIDGVNYLPQGNQEQVRNFNLNSDILVIPRQSNIVNDISFPSKLFEYLYSGNPVVASDVGGLSRILKDKENVLLYQPGDTEGFLKCLVQLENNDLRQTIGMNGKSLIMSKFNWEVQGRLLKEYLLSIK